MPETLGTDPGRGISGYGTTLEGATTGPIGMLNKLTIEGVEADEYDITTMNSPDRFKDFIPGLKDAKTLQGELVYEPANTAVLMGAVGSDPEVWTVTYPDGSTLVGKGYIKKLGQAIPFNDKISQTMTLRCLGPWVFHKASGA